MRKILLNMTALTMGIAFAACTPTEDLDINVSSITINPAEEISIVEGTSVELSVTVLPENATDKTVTWTSEHEAVATVNAEGQVTGQSAGTATIRATANDGSGVFATKTISVTTDEIKVSSIAIIPEEEISIVEGTSVDLSVTVLPENATDKTVTWSSLHEAVATVNAEGQVTGVSAGTATIRATARDGSGVFATKTISVRSADVIKITTTFNGAMILYLIGTGSATINWGDGHSDNITLTNPAVLVDISNYPFPHTYASGALKTITITGSNIVGVATGRTQAVTALDLSKAPALKFLNCNEEKLTTLDITKNTELTYLDCSWNNLSALNVTKSTELTHLLCEVNNLSTLDVTKNAELTYLLCGGNNLSTLNLTKNTKLKYLTCGSKNLSALDITKNTELKVLSCSFSKLSTLDVTKNTELTHLDCSWNNLSALNVTKSTELTHLACQNNNLSALDVTKNTKLIFLWCAWNNLTTLDVTKNTELTDLSCSFNKLSTLDVTKNIKLITLWCDFNNLSSLDVTKSTELKELTCGDNKLSTLDVSKNTKLTVLRCGWNNLTTLDVTKNIELTRLDCAGNSLNALRLNAVFTALPNRTGLSAGEAYVGNNPGTTQAGYNPSIATGKNWHIFSY